MRTLAWLSTAQPQRAAQGRSGQLTVFGKVLSERQKPVADVTLRLIGQPLNAGTAAYTASTQTDASGQYRFSLSDDFFATQTLVIQPEKTGNPRQGVNEADVSLVSAYLNGTSPLNPYQLLAADVVPSGSITTFDVVQLRKLIAGGSVPGFRNWVFVPSTYRFTQPQNPWSSATGPLTNRVVLTAPPTESVDFVGVKVGDVDPTILRAPTARLGQAQ